MDYKDYQAGGAQTFFWFRGKEELLDVLLQKAGVRQGGTLLNLGAGTGSDTATLTRYGAVSAFDACAEALALIPDTLVAEKRVGDARALPYADQSFDVVVAADLLEHIADDATVVREIHRVLNVGGSFVLTVPAFNWLFSARDTALGHVRRYNQQMLTSLLTNFSQVDLGYWNCALFVPVAIQRLMARHAKPGLETFTVPAWINACLLTVLRLENWLIAKRVRLPVGITLYAVCRKHVSIPMPPESQASSRNARARTP